MSKYYLAVDIGASSGRHIVGWAEDNKIETKEIYRFKTGFKQTVSCLTCDVKRLYRNVLKGIKLALEQFSNIESLAIDTWGVDYVLMNGEHELLPCVSYRDERTAKAVEIVHKNIPFEQLYKRTGIQFQPFNTIYQLFDDKLAGKLNTATDFLMLPEYLNYKLTGNKVKEYTNATTTGLVNAFTKQFDEEIISQLSLPTHLFGELHEAGTTVGELTPEVQQYVNGNCKVKLCLSHDTASAVYGVPLDDDSLYLSSGTWSLLGVTTDKPLTDENSLQANYSNEGGINRTVRYQKNITGMWAVNRAVEELHIKSPAVFVELAKTSDYAETVNLNDTVFNNPVSFVQAIKDTLIKANKPQPKNTADVANCIFHSLAKLYAEAIEQLETNVGKTYTKLYIVGGGAKNKYLNELAERYTQKQVIALPIEATAIGNLRIQIESDN